MNTKARLLFAAAAAVLLLGAAQAAVAGGSMDVKKHASMAPVSIPIPQTGTTLIGMTELELCTSATVGSGPTYGLSQMVLNLTKTGSFTDSDIQSIRVYFEAHGGNGVYDNGAGVDDVDTLGAGAPFTFSGGTATVAIDPTKNTVDDVANGNDHFYVIFELKSGALVSACSIGCEITSITYGNKPGGTGGAGSPKTVTAHGVQKPVDAYAVTMAATGIVLNAEEFQGSTNVQVLKLILTPTDLDASTKISLGSLKVHTKGTRDADLTAGGVLLYEDTNDNGTFDGGDTSLASTTLTSGYATMSPAAPVSVPTAGKTFFVTVNVATSAVVGNTVGFEIENPSTDLVFVDVIPDDQPGPNYANVAIGYVQKGYVTPTAPTPTTSNTFLVKLQVVPQNPIVSSIVPGNNATGVARTASVVATFSKPMDLSTITTTTFKLFDGATPVAGSVSYDGPTQTATFSPTGDLDWNKTYTATVYGDGFTGVRDSVDGLYMLSNKVWSFTTVFAVYPTVLSSTPASNQIEVPRSSNVSVVFSKDMDDLTITTATFTVFDGASNITGTVGYDSGTRTATFTPQPPDSPLDWGKTYTATVTTDATDTDGLSLQNDRIWLFTTTMPVYPAVTTTSPTNGATEVPRSATVTALFSKEMVKASVEGAFSLKDSSNATVTGNAVYDEPLKTLTFTLTPPGSTLLWGEMYTARITTAATDTQGLAMQSDKVWVFTTTMPVYPVVTLTNPANGDTEVSRSTTVAATFSRNMNEASVEAAGVFTLKDHNNNTVTASSIDYVDGTKTVTFTPDSTLLWGETYTARVAATAMTTDGLTMQSDKVWTFTTTMPVYPMVLNTSPADGTTGVARNTTISAVFSKDMESSTIESPATTFVVKNGAIPIAGTVTYVAGTRTATFTPQAPDSPLDWGTTYNVTIVSGSAGVKATDGLAMQADKVWTFTTVVAVNPVVVNTSPVANASNVLPDANVTATFSKSMNDASVEAAGVFKVFIDVDEDGVYDAAGDTLVGGTVDYVEAGSPPKTATFNPSSDLLPGVKYTAVVTTGAQDTTALPLLADHTWSFWVSNRPEVLLMSPAKDSVGVSRGTDIKAVFSKNVQNVNGTTFLVKDGAGNPVAGSVSYTSSNFTATFDPDPDLLFDSYTVTIKTGPGGVESDDTVPIEMALPDVTWTFSTKPTLDEPVAANNKITPTSTDPVTIFIPQPTADPADRVTVQVFTATGKKVRTLINNQPWNSFEASLPLLWDGTNDRGERLGPGLYFIQIRATKYVRSLKAMIVR